MLILAEYLCKFSFPARYNIILLKNIFPQLLKNISSKIYLGLIINSAGPSYNALQNHVISLYIIHQLLAFHFQEYSVRDGTCM